MSSGRYGKEVLTEVTEKEEEKGRKVRGQCYKALTITVNQGMAKYSLLVIQLLYEAFFGVNCFINSLFFADM